MLLSRPLGLNTTKKFKQLPFMHQSKRLEEFKKSVTNKFNIYNSLFLSLPYQNVENVGMLIPLLLINVKKD